MKIQSMFADDINRQINGVIKVDQQDASTESEVREYVVTKELKKHFISFFNHYCDSFAQPTDDTGVWISGFFGSGKSHFLKMLSFILENRTINGVKTVERFRAKFADDPATFMLIDKATRGKTETILFNIDIEGSINKDKTAVLRVFAKMFYNHLGYYGENLKVAMLEQYIDRLGKTEEFRRVFEAKKGKPWVEMRRAFAFNGKAIIPSLMEVLDMSEDDAKSWFNDKTSIDMSIAQLVEDINEYVSRQPKDFRLLFMIDEVGQYVGADTDMLLNLQSLIEKIGSECGGRVWIVCTGQEAIDEIIKVRADAFSRIQARFAVRLSLSSSAVDEVIQKRILSKKPEATKTLEAIYDQNESVLRNLFSFTDSILDIKGYGGSSEFAIDFPFVPYQFILLQKAFVEIRKHGNAGKHHSDAERSMLSGFQEAAKKVQDRDEYSLVPFFRFYDTVHSFLDSSIRRVIERCEKAAQDGNGIESQDVDVLKLLYLVRYIDDVKANIDNIAILMADDIRTDKIVLREAISASLNRLAGQNYIGRNGDTYNFLTDEEQDIQRAINNETQVDTAAIVERIAHMIYGDIYTTKKYRYGKYDFAFDQMVDGVAVGALTGGMKLRFLTVATSPQDKSDLKLMTDSMGQAIVVLAETPYYDSLETAMKIRKYVKQRNVTELPKSVQTIIQEKQNEAGLYESEVMDCLADAIVSAAFYVAGERIELKPGAVSAKSDDPKTRESEIKRGKARSVIDQALEYLVAHVYSELDLIVKNVETDDEIIAVLSGGQVSLTGMGPNSDAAAKMEDYLEMQFANKLPTSMADIQGRYQAIPYGWKEIDIAAVAALLIYEQKVTVKYGGVTIQPGNPKLPDMLRKKSEIGKTTISKRQVISLVKLKQVKEFLREYFDIMDVPDDEDGLIAFIIEKMGKQKDHFAALLSRYEGHKYPDKVLIQNSIAMIEDVLSQQKDNIALIDRVLAKREALLDNKDDVANVEGFFASQVAIFDAAVKMEHDLSNELAYLAKEPESNTALNQIRLITQLVTDVKLIYRRIPELNELMKTVSAGHDRLLSAKRDELLEIVRQCMEAIHTTAGSTIDAKNIITTADTFYTQQKERIAQLRSLALLDGLVPPMITYKDETVEKLELMNKPVPPKPVAPPTPEQPGKPAPKKLIKALNRQVVFPAKQLESEADIDAYVEKVRAQLKALMQNCDGIKLN